MSNNESFYYNLYANGERVWTRFDEANALGLHDRYKEHGFNVRLIRYFNGPREEAFRFAVVEWNDEESKWETITRGLGQPTIETANSGKRGECEP